MKTVARWFVGVAKGALSIGKDTVPMILEVVSPGLGTLIAAIVQAVLRAEAQFGAGRGAEKMEAALGMVEVAAPASVAAIERATGRELADEEQFAEGIRLITEGVVKLLNAFRVLPPPPA